MTYGQNYGQQDPRGQWPPQYGQPGPWQQEERGGSWRREQYDPGAHQQRLGQPPPQHSPQGPPYPPQGQPWPQAGYPPPQKPPGWQPPGYGQQPPYGPPGDSRPPWDPRPAAQFPRHASPRKSWPARHKVASAFIAFGCIAVIAAAARAATTSAKPAAATARAATSSAPPAPTSAAAATQAAAAVTDPDGQQCASLDSLGYCPGDDPSPMQQWCSGTGYTDFQSVESDLSQLGQDAGDDDLAAVEQDGATLAQDASSIESTLPPLSNAHKVTFGVWMGYMSLAGIKASQGDIGGASSLMEDATQYNSIVTYVSNQCGGN